MDFLAGVAVGLEADAGFEELDLGGGFGGGGLFRGFLRGCGRRGRLLGTRSDVAETDGKP